MSEAHTPVRYAWISVATALGTMALKAAAWWLTDSVALLSDALESSVNLAAALLAVLLLRVAAEPPDEEHAFGHDKAEYFSSGIEGSLVLAAAVAMGWAAVDRWLHPRALAHLGVGLAVSVVAGGVNLAVALLLRRAGRRLASVALEADAEHLMTDVWTTAVAVVGAGLVALSGRGWVDPLFALGVAVYVAYAGLGIVARSVRALLDPVIPAGEREALEAVLRGFAGAEVSFHRVRTRASGARRFVDMHVLVPGAWSVQRGHDLAERVEAAVRAAIPGAQVLTHVEPSEDPAALND